ncbi:hypothetical protein ACP4OV_016426 [Aristida adscensionis]
MPLHYAARPQDMASPSPLLRRPSHLALDCSRPFPAAVLLSTSGRVSSNTRCASFLCPRKSPAEMTSTSSGKAALGGGGGGGDDGGGGGNRSTRPALRGRWRMKIKKNQEKNVNSERPDGGAPQDPAVAVVVVAPGLTASPPEEPVMPKRGRGAGEEIICWSWSVKKPRSGFRANWSAAIAAAFPAFQEPEPACKMGHLVPGGRAGEAAEDERKEEEKVRPCELADPVHGLQESKVAVLDLSLALAAAQKPAKPERCTDGDGQVWLLKKCCHASPAPCKEHSAAVDQVNMQVPSTLSPGTPERLRRSIPVQEAMEEPRGNSKRTTFKPSDCKITYQPSMSLSARLQCLGVTNVTPVLAKTLTCTDCNVSQARLLLPYQLVMDSPLMRMLTPDEHEAVHEKKLPLVALDRHGRSYDLCFRYLKSINGYRLIKGWGEFLRQNGLCEDDLVEIGAFRVHGKLMLTILHYAKDEWSHEETVAAEGLLMLSDFKDRKMLQ